MGKTKTIDQMAIERDKTESNGEAAGDETEKSEGLSGMREIEDPRNDHFQTKPHSMESEERSWRAKENDLAPILFLFESGMRILPKHG